MQWNDLWDKEHQPSHDHIQEFVATPLWAELAGYLQQTYNVKPKLSYSACSMDKGSWKGWNVKYQKNGKALSTLYPKQGYFVVLINMGARELPRAELLIPHCSEYIQKLYTASKTGTSGKSLAIHVTSEAVLRDLKELIALRVEAR